MNSFSSVDEIIDHLVYSVKVYKEHGNQQQAAFVKDCRGPVSQGQATNLQIVRSATCGGAL